MSCFLEAQGCKLAGGNECSEDECPHYNWHDSPYDDIYPQGGDFFVVEIKREVQYFGKKVIGFATDVLAPGVFTIVPAEQKKKPVGRKRKSNQLKLKLPIGTKKRDVDRAMARQISQAIDRAIAIRLKQYNDLKWLTPAIHRHKHEAALWAIWRRYKGSQLPGNVESFFEQFLEDIGLEKPQKL